MSASPKLRSAMLLLMLLLSTVVLVALTPDVFTRAATWSTSPLLPALGASLLLLIALELVSWGLAAFARAAFRRARLHPGRTSTPLALLLAAGVAGLVFLIARSPVNALRYDLSNALASGLVAFGALLTLRNIGLNLRTLVGPARVEPAGHVGGPRPASPVSPAPWTLDRLKRLEPRELERLVAGLYQQQGDQVRLTPVSRDGGMDVILVRGTRRLLVECKTVEVVGEPMLRTLYGSITLDRADGGIFVTTGRFSRDAVLGAHQMNIELVDDMHLLTLLNRAGHVPLFPEPVA